MLAPSPIAGKTVVTAQLDDGNALHDFPVYSLSSDTATKSECNGACARTWLPLLTSGTPGVTAPLKTSELGTFKRADGTTQVTYRGKPLYLYSLEGVVTRAAGGGHAAGNGNGKAGPDGGSFSLVTPDNRARSRPADTSRVGSEARHNSVTYVVCVLYAHHAL